MEAEIKVNQLTEENTNKFDKYMKAYIIGRDEYFRSKAPYRIL